MDLFKQSEIENHEENQEIHFKNLYKFICISSREINTWSSKKR